MSLCSLSSRLGYDDIAPPGLRAVQELAAFELKPNAWKKEQRRDRC
jgi:hypothetical protein